MSIWIKFPFLYAFFFLGVMPMDESKQGVSPCSAEFFFKASWKGTFQPVNSDQFKLYRSQFAALFEHLGQWESARQEMEKLGFQIEMIELSGDERVLVLREKEPSFTGKGFYLVRVGKQDFPLLIQAPHRSFDKLTGEICLKMFLENPIQAAAFNTISRKNMDVAHADLTVFQAFTMAYADVHPQGRIVQLHGYSSSKRNSKSGLEADMILSDTTKNPSIWTHDVYTGLLDLTGLKIKLYGVDTRELGGTTNVQGKALKNQGFFNFLHLETRFPVRQELDKSEALRHAVYKAIRSQHEN